MLVGVTKVSTSMPNTEILTSKDTQEEAQSYSFRKAYSTSANTVFVPPSTTVKLEQSATSAKRAVWDALSVYIMGEETPFVLHNPGVILLGRAFPEGQPGCIDLDRFNGQQLGVSRKHARIHAHWNRIALTTLDSLNGTWVNEKRLNPFEEQNLQNGDMIRLSQLTLFVYFK